MMFTPSQWAGFVGDGAEATLRLAKGVLKHPPKAIGTGLFGLDLAITLGTSERRDVITNIGGSIAGNGLALAGTMVGTAFGGPIGGIIGGAVGDYIGRTGTVKSIREALSVSRNSRANFGGHYIDTEAAHTMRQVAARELGGSLLNARRYLGNEGVMAH